MRRLRPALLIGSGAAFTLLGAWLLIRGHGAERLMGLAAVLFFGGGGAMVLVLRWLQRRRGVAQERVVVDHRGRRVAALVFPVSRGGATVAVIGAGAMAAAGTCMVGFAIAAEGGWLLGAIGVVGAAVFGAFAVLGARGLAGPSFVALSNEGVISTTPFGHVFVEWSNVREVGVMQMGDTPTVTVAVADARAVEAGPIARRVFAANRKLVGAELAFSNLEVAAEELATAIEQYRDHPAQRAALGGAATMPPPDPR